MVAHNEMIIITISVFNVFVTFACPKVTQNAAGEFPLQPPIRTLERFTEPNRIFYRSSSVRVAVLHALYRLVLLILRFSTNGSCCLQMPDPFGEVAEGTPGFDVKRFVEPTKHYIKFKILQGSRGDQWSPDLCRFIVI